MFGPLYLFLSDEGSGIRSMTQTLDRVQHAVGSAHIDLCLGVLVGNWQDHGLGL